MSHEPLVNRKSAIANLQRDGPVVSRHVAGRLTLHATIAFSLSHFLTLSLKMSKSLSVNRNYLSVRDQRAC